MLHDLNARRNNLRILKRGSRRDREGIHRRRISQTVEMSNNDGSNIFLGDDFLLLMKRKSSKMKKSLKTEIVLPKPLCVFTQTNFVQFILNHSSH